MKKASLLPLLFLFTSCTNESKISIKQLQGYWEIEFIEQKGEVFKSNQKTPLYDYYSLENNKGYYKKVAPQIGGNYQTSEIAIPFEIQEENGIFKLYFTSPWNSWQKTIKVLNLDQLVLFHQGRNFNYKRVKPTSPRNNVESNK